MRIKPEIAIRSDKLSHGFTEAVKLCAGLESANNEITIDLSDTRFVTPSFLLPVIVYIHQLREHVNMTNVGTYLSAIHFPEGGVNAATFTRTAAFKSYMESYSKRNYISHHKISDRPSRQRQTQCDTGMY